MVSIYPLILSFCDRQLEHHVSALNLHTTILKKLARKQNFKNLPFSLAKHHQKMECCNFINNQLKPELRPLFAIEKRFGVIKLMEDNETADIRIKYQRSGLLPGVTLKSVCSILGCLF